MSLTARLSQIKMEHDASIVITGAMRACMHSHAASAADDSMPELVVLHQAEPLERPARRRVDGVARGVP